MSIEAMKQALEALAWVEPCDSTQAMENAITSLRQAIEQAQKQEPVAWIYERARFGPTDLRGQQWRLELSRLKPWDGNGLVRNIQPLYTSPPQRQPLVGLTDEEVHECLNGLPTQTIDVYARRIEAKLKEKNT